MSRCRALGLDTIAVRFLDIDAIVRGESDENKLRLDFTPSECVAIGRDVEAAYSKGHGGDRRSVQVQKVAHESDGAKTRDIAAKKAGFGNAETYRQAKKVVDKGVPELVEAMDAGEVSISAAAKVAALPQEKQREILSPAAQEGAPYARAVACQAARISASIMSMAPARRSLS